MEDVVYREVEGFMVDDPYEVEKDVSDHNQEQGDIDMGEDNQDADAENETHKLPPTPNSSQNEEEEGDNKGDKGDDEVNENEGK